VDFNGRMTAEVITEEFTASLDIDITWNSQRK